MVSNMYCNIDLPFEMTFWPLKLFGFPFNEVNQQKPVFSLFYSVGWLSNKEVSQDMQLAEIIQLLNIFCIALSQSYYIQSFFFCELVKFLLKKQAFEEFGIDQFRKHLISRLLKIFIVPKHILLFRVINSFYQVFNLFGSTELSSNATLLTIHF